MISKYIVKFNKSYDYDAFSKDLHALCVAYPMLQTEVIGKSVMGKPLHAIRIGEGPIGIHFNGAVHANEWITSALLMRFAEECAVALYDDMPWRPELDEQLDQATLKHLLKRHVSLWIVPMVNPDGVDLSIHGLNESHPYYWRIKAWNKGSELYQHWKANIRGVDLNDQFPAHWDEEVSRRAIAHPGPRDYPGKAPLTEPEAAALASFTDRMNFEAVFSFHTQGEEIYWNYRGYEPHHARELAEHLGNVSGYEAIELSGSDAGYKDWFIQKYHRPGFTIEAGFGENPLPIEDATLIYRQLKPLMIAGLSLLI